MKYIDGDLSLDLNDLNFRWLRNMQDSLESSVVGWRMKNEDTYSGFVKFIKLRGEVEGDALGGAVESDTADEQHRQQEVREKSREVNHFASAFDTLPDAEVADEPDERQCADQLPAKSSYRFQSAGYFQYSIAALEIVQLSILIIKS